MRNRVLSFILNRPRWWKLRACWGAFRSPEEVFVAIQKTGTELKVVLSLQDRPHTETVRYLIELAEISDAIFGTEESPHE